MGSALLQGIVSRGVCAAEDITVSDPYPAALEALKKLLPGVNVADGNLEAAFSADTVLLCTKPPDIVPVIEALSALPEPKLLLSIAAGVTLTAMDFAAGKHRIIRAMPNTPALIGMGAAAYSLGEHATMEDAAVAEKILGSVGTVTRVAEKLLDAVTGLSGSGPAYVYEIIDALSAGGVLMGLTKAQALQLAAQTVAGAASMVLETGEHPAVLRDQVTSPGGTTIAGLTALENRGLRAALIDAVRSAALRAQELGKAPRPIV